MKKLYRSRTNTVFSGVLGGFAEYLSVDATLLRVLFVVFVLVTGFFPGVFAYIIAIFLMPVAPEAKIYDVPPEETKEPDSPAGN